MSSSKIIVGRRYQKHQFQGCTLAYPKRVVRRIARTKKALVKRSWKHSVMVDNCHTSGYKNKILNEQKKNKPRNKQLQIIIPLFQSKYQCVTILFWAISKQVYHFPIQRTICGSYLFKAHKIPQMYLMDGITQNIHTRDSTSPQLLKKLLCKWIKMAK